MMFPRLRLINKNQLGFTLIELALAIAISSVITGAITATIYQLVNGNLRTSNHMTAVRQVQEAGYFISLDTLMAQSIIFDDPATGVTEFLTLTWTDWDSKVHRIAYTLEDIAGSEVKNLQRSHSRDGTTEASIIAQFIEPDPAKTKCELTGGGTFALPDTGDEFTITAGPVADSGTITVITGSISVTPSGGATYNVSTGAWTIPATSGTVVVKKLSGTSTAAGVWTSTSSSAKVTITYDSDRDATVTGSVLISTVTASVGTGLQGQSETRVYKIVPRPGS